MGPLILPCEVAAELWITVVQSEGGRNLYNLKKKILKRSDAFLIDNRRHRFFFVRLCVFTCAKLHIQIFVDQQTNISIEDIFVQAFRYRKGGERAGYGSTVDVLCYPAKPISLPDPCPYAFFL